jgi:hypothetical protein
MPLIKSASQEAFRRNAQEMMKAGHPRDQSLAAAGRIQREARSEADAVLRRQAKAHRGKSRGG